MRQKPQVSAFFVKLVFFSSVKKSAQKITAEKIKVSSVKYKDSYNGMEATPIGNLYEIFFEHLKHAVAEWEWSEDEWALQLHPLL